MNPKICYSIFIFIALSISVKTAPSVEELYEEADTCAKKVEKVYSGPIRELLEVFHKAKDSCLLLEEKYLEKGSDMIRNMVKRLLNHYRSSESSDSFSDDRKQKLEEMFSELKYEFSKCITHVVNKAIKSTNTDIQTVKLILDNVTAARNQLKECKAKDQPRICLLNLRKNFKYLESNLGQQISEISKAAPNIYENLAENLDGCLSKTVAVIVNQAPEIVTAVKEENEYCYSE